MNLVPLIRAFNHILANPDSWDQYAWHCGTTHCLFGHCQILAGLPESNDTCRDDVIKLTGISSEDASWLSRPSRTLPEIHHFLAGEFDRFGYDRSGYDRFGYDRSGYNPSGYDRSGYDRFGYDRFGYDRSGYDRSGYNRSGYNRFGYDRSGYNRSGYNRFGRCLQPIPIPDGATP